MLWRVTLHDASNIDLCGTIMCMMIHSFCDIGWLTSRLHRVVFRGQRPAHHFVVYYILLSYVYDLDQPLLVACLRAHMKRNTVLPCLP